MRLSDELLAAYLDGNVSAEDAGAVMSGLAADREAREILSLSPEIDRDVETSRRRDLPMRALAAAAPGNLCSFECEMAILRRRGVDADHWSLLETAKANNWITEGGTPLHHVGRLLELKGLDVKRVYDAHAGLIERALEEGKDVIAVVGKETLLDRQERGADAMHAINITKTDPAEGCAISYLDTEDGQERHAGGAEFLSAWKKSGNYIVIVSASETAYDPRPIDVGDIVLDGDLEELTEAIAENAHDIWARARMDEGWTYGPVRDDAGKRHPDLVPYAKLPDSEKEYDRIMAMNTLRLVRRLGFDIVNTVED